MKRFLVWIGVKQQLDDHVYTPPFVSEGDIWWCSLGENVGVEVDGKNERFTRPVVILKKFGRLGFLVVPLTTKEKNGSWYVSFVYHDVRQAAALNQVRFVSYKRLDKRMGTVSDSDFKRIKEAYISLLSE